MVSKLLGHSLYFFFMCVCVLLSENVLLVSIEEKEQGRWTATLIWCSNLPVFTTVCWELAEDIVFEETVILSKLCLLQWILYSGPEQPICKYEYLL